MPTFILPEYVLKHLPERKRNDYGVVRSINGEENKLLVLQKQRGKKLRKYSFPPYLMAFEELHLKIKHYIDKFLSLLDRALS